MICLMILMIISCQSTNTYYVENAGAKFELANKRGSYIDSVDYRNYDRIDNNYKKTKAVGFYETQDEKEKQINKKEVSKVEDLNSIITALGSAIAGIYCLIKTIMGAIKKIKKINQQEGQILWNIKFKDGYIAEAGKLNPR